MFHRFICRCLVMLFGVPLSLLGHDDGTSPSGGKISFAYRQIKHSFSYMLFKSSAIKICLGVQRALIAAIAAVMKIHTRYHLLSGHSRWHSSKYCGAEFEESYSESVTLF